MMITAFFRNVKINQEIPAIVSFALANIFIIKLELYQDISSVSASSMCNSKQPGPKNKYDLRIYIIFNGYL